MAPVYCMHLGGFSIRRLRKREDAILNIAFVPFDGGKTNIELAQTCYAKVDGAIDVGTIQFLVIRARAHHNN